MSDRISRRSLLELGSLDVQQLPHTRGSEPVSLPRRAAMRAGLGAFTAGMLGPLALGEAEAAAAAGPFAMAPDWRTNWVVHKDPTLGASVTQLANGVILKAAPYVYSNDQDLLSRSSIVLWSKASLSGNFRASFSFTRLDDITKTTGTGIGAMLYFHALGLGDSEHPLSFAEWPSTKPSEGDYIRYGKGLRVTWSNFNTVVPSNSNQIRLRWFEFTTSYPVQIGKPSPASFPFTRNVRYAITFTCSGNSFTVAVRNTKTGKVARWGWTESTIGRFSNGYFGIRQQPGRIARYENLVIAPI